MGLLYNLSLLSEAMCILGLQKGPGLSKPQKCPNLACLGHFWVPFGGGVQNTFFGGPWKINCQLCFWRPKLAFSQGIYCQLCFRRPKLALPPINKLSTLLQEAKMAFQQGIHCQLCFKRPERAFSPRNKLSTLLQEAKIA